MQVIYVEQYNLYDFLVAVQEAVLNGYRMSETNEHYPSGYSGYRVGMTKEEDVNAVQNTVEGNGEQTTKPAPIKIKPARPAK